MNKEEQIGFPRSEKDRKKIREKSLHKIDFGHRIFHSYDFIACDLRGSYFMESIFIDCNFISTSLITAIFANSVFLNCNFLSCCIRHANFKEALLSDCVIQDCDFFLADFSEAEFFPHDFDRATLVGASGLSAG
ncbi:MAG: pentapeptide repeat-containing protein [Gammaproteobacteria bacterium]|jgi:uncharacterized protein YjbI with pentapeptide repeats|nr:pentapeptide repeat-containing protein [Gammaproteobacteria bacterium]MBU2200795.1 pentapeptide repeat-containing protein [Gammaproteobacteria bacterium]